MKIIGIFISFLAIAIAFITCELGLGLLKAKGAAFFHNPVIQKQAADSAVFEPDATLGHRLKGAGLLDRKSRSLKPLSEIISNAEEAMHQGKEIILNFGDSSTSGWDSDVVAENAHQVSSDGKVQSPFFTYLTYSDILSERRNTHVINAGVPGYSSVQGSIFGSEVLHSLRDRGVTPRYVTIYFGNNDSAWNGNYQDLNFVRSPDRGLMQLRLIELIARFMERKILVSRVLTSDYNFAIRRLINEVREFGAHPILIRPIIPYNWPPALRANGLEAEVASLHSSLKGTKAEVLLSESEKSYQLGKSHLGAGNNTEAKRAFIDAQNSDFIVPRIKPPFVEVLKQIAHEENIPLVDVQSDIPADDKSYFIDYCHPIEPGNRMIVKALEEIIDHPVQ